MKSVNENIPKSFKVVRFNCPESLNQTAKYSNPKRSQFVEKLVSYLNRLENKFAFMLEPLRVRNFCIRNTVCHRRVTFRLSDSMERALISLVSSPFQNEISKSRSPEANKNSNAHVANLTHATSTLRSLIRVSDEHQFTIISFKRFV